MARYSDIFRDTITLKPIAGALVTVTDYAGRLATLTTDGGGALDNPFVTGGTGEVVFNASDGKYDITYSYGGRVVSVVKGQTVGTVIIAVDPSPANAGQFIRLDGAGVPTFSSGSLPYAKTSTYSLNFGYDAATATAAAVRIGANDAFRGNGVLQIGGAGPKDGGDGTYVANDGHPNWNALQSSIPFNPTEWNIYGNGTGGVAVSTGTTTIARSTGSAWGAFMNGLTLWFDGIAYTVVTASANSATLNSAPPAGTACWQFVYTTGSGTCTVSGGTVTRVSGTPFIPPGFGLIQFTLNGTAYTVSAIIDPDTYTISSPPANGTYTYTYRANINWQVSTLRLQLTTGGDEENLSGYAAPYGYVMGAQQSGYGKLRDWNLTSEYQAVLGLAAYGKFVSLGGPQGNEAIRALWNSGAVNRVDALGAPTGFSPSFRGRGADTNVGLAFDAKGSGVHSFTSNSFGSVEFQIQSGGGASWLSAYSAATAPVIAANGAATNIDVRLIPKGTGAIWLGSWTSNADAAVNGYITVKDAAGNIRKIATIA